MTHLYLIRHAQTEGLKAGIAGSVTPNSGLSLLGVRQAELLRDRLTSTGEIKADVLISSTLNRAMKTAEIIAPALGLPVLPNDEVQELNIGDLEGLTEAKIEERFGSFSLRTESLPVLGGQEILLKLSILLTFAANDSPTRISRQLSVLPA